MDEDGKELTGSKTASTPDAVVTEYPVEIPGYTPRLFSLTLELSADEENNIIRFVYDPADTELEIWKKGANEPLSRMRTLCFVSGVRRLSTRGLT